MRLSHEQTDSAHFALMGADIRHGDTTEVEIAVGASPSVRDEVRFTFCSAKVRRKKVRRKGWWWDRRRPIQGDLHFSNGDEIARRIGRRCGMVFMRGTVTSNGHVEFDIDLDSIRVVPVLPREEHQLHCASGQEFAEEVLETMSA